MDAYIAEYYSVPIIRNGLKIRSPIGNNEKIGIKAYGEYSKLKSCILRATFDQMEFMQKAVNDMKNKVCFYSRYLKLQWLGNLPYFFTRKSLND